MCRPNTRSSKPWLDAWIDEVHPWNLANGACRRW